MVRQLAIWSVFAILTGCRAPTPTFDPFAGHATVPPPSTGAIQGGTADPYYPPPGAVPPPYNYQQPPITPPNIQLPGPSGQYPSGANSNNFNRRADAGAPAARGGSSVTLAGGVSPQAEPTYPVKPVSYEEQANPRPQAEAVTNQGTVIKLVVPGSGQTAPDGGQVVPSGQNASQPQGTGGWTSSGRSAGRPLGNGGVQNIEDLPPARSTRLQAAASGQASFRTANQTESYPNR
jgi:hypothetical protein